jgi:hypothetical protein
MHKKLADYKEGDVVEVFTANPKIGRVWHSGEVVGSSIVHPGTGERFKPYTMLFVSFQRTYCKAEDIMKFDPKIGFTRFMGQTLTYYEKLNTEGFVYDEEVRDVPLFKTV